MHYKRMDEIGTLQLQDNMYIAIHINITCNCVWYKSALHRIKFSKLETQAKQTSKPIETSRNSPADMRAAISIEKRNQVLKIANRLNPQC